MTPPLETQSPPDTAGEDIDTALMAQVAGGDQRAYSGLVDRHALRLRGLARRYVGDHAAAEDVVQDVFIKLWQKPDSFDSRRGRFQPWVNRMVINRALDYQRRRRDVALPDGFDQADGRAGADQVIDDAQRDARLMQAVRSLGDKQQTALILTYFEGQANKDSAESMDMGLKAFESLLGRARKALKTALDRMERTGS